MESLVRNKSYLNALFYLFPKSLIGILFFSILRLFCFLSFGRSYFYPISLFRFFLDLFALFIFSDPRKRFALSTSTTTTPATTTTTTTATTLPTMATTPMMTTTKAITTSETITSTLTTTATSTTTTPMRLTTPTTTATSPTTTATSQPLFSHLTFFLFR